MRWGAALVLLGASTLALAQESALHAELRREGSVRRMPARLALRRCPDARTRCLPTIHYT